MENSREYTRTMDFSKCWEDWKSTLKQSIESSRGYYKDETVPELLEKLEDFLSKKICSSAAGEEVVEAMWEAASPEERQTLANLFLRIADRL